LSAPSAVAIKSMKSVGLSAQEVKDTLVNQGLPEAFQLIEDAVGKKFPASSVEYETALKNILGGLVGLKTAAMITGGSLQTTKDNISAIATAMNSSDKSVMGFSDLQGNLNFQLDRLNQSFQVFLITLGQKLLPIVTPLVKVLADIVGGMSGLAGGTGQAGEAVSGLGKAFQQMKAFFQPVLDVIIEAMKQLGSFIKAVFVPVWNELVKTFQDQVKPAWDDLVKALGPIMPELAQVGKIILISVIVPLAALIVILAAVIVGIAKFAAVLINVLSGSIQAAAGVIAFFVDLFTGKFGKLGQDLDIIMGGIARIFGLSWEQVKKVTVDVVTAIVKWAQDTWTGFLQWLSGLWKHIQEIWNGAIKWFEDLWNSIIKGIQGAWNGVIAFFQNLWKKITDGVSSAWVAIVKAVTGAWNGVIGFFVDLWNDIEKAFEGITRDIIKAFQDFANSVLGIFQWLYDHNKYIQAMVEAIKQAIPAFIKWFQEQWTNVGNWLRDRWNWVSDQAKSIWGHITDSVKTGTNNTTDGLKTAWNTTGNWLHDRWSWLSDQAKSIWAKISDTAKSVWGAITDWVKGAWSATGDWLHDRWNWISDQAKSIWAKISDTFHTVTTAIGNWIKSVWTDITSWLADRWNGWVVDNIKKAWKAISDVITNAWTNYIAPAFQALWQHVVDWWNGVLKFFGDMGTNLMKALADGIKKAVGAVTTAIHDAIKSALNNLGFMNVPGFAGGVSNFAGGWAVVGEKGPELMFLPSGSSIIPSGNPPPVASSFSGSTGDQNQIIYVMLDSKVLAKAVTKYQTGELRVQGVIRGI